MPHRKSKDPTVSDVIKINIIARAARLRLFSFPLFSGFSFLKLIAPIAILIALVGCSRDGYKPQSGDLGAFIVEQAMKFGAHPRTSDGTPSFAAKWTYRETSDMTGRKVTVLLEGDHVAQLNPFLLATFGTPVFPVSTDSKNGVVLGLYSSDGVAVQFLCVENGGKPYTRIEIQGSRKQ